MNYCTNCGILNSVSISTLYKSNLVLDTKNGIQKIKASTICDSYVFAILSRFILRLTVKVNYWRHSLTFSLNTAVVCMYASLTKQNRNAQKREIPMDVGMGKYHLWQVQTRRQLDEGVLKVFKVSPLAVRCILWLIMWEYWHAIIVVHVPHLPSSTPWISL